MKICPNCGTSIKNADSKFYSNCGSQLENKEMIFKQSRKQVNFKDITNKKFIIPAAVAAFVVIVLLFTSGTSKSVSNPILEECSSLLGASCENILEDDEFTTSSLFGITIAKKRTNSLFGIDGEIEIFLLDYDEPVDIVTWQSEDDIKFTDSEIKTFINGIKSEYGKPYSSDEDSTLWHNEDYTVSVEATNEEIYIMWANGNE